MHGYRARGWSEVRGLDVTPLVLLPAYNLEGQSSIRPMLSFRHASVPGGRRAVRSSPSRPLFPATSRREFVETLCRSRYATASPQRFSPVLASVWCPFLSEQRAELGGCGNWAWLRWPKWRAEMYPCWLTETRTLCSLVSACLRRIRLPLVVLSYLVRTRKIDAASWPAGGQ